MRKISFKRVFTFLIVALMIFTLAACGDKDDKVDGNNNDNQQVENKDSNSLDGGWGIKINGKAVTLPCTLSDLVKIDVNIYSEFDKETILNSANETFTMIAATYGENTEPIHLKIVTGSAADKKEANATVKIITNTKMDSSLFELKGGIALGSSIDDVIKTFGTDYNMTGATGDDIHSGYIVINYGTKADGAMFNFKDGILEYIEILADKGE